MKNNRTQTGMKFRNDPSFNETPNLTDSENEGGEEDIEDFVQNAGVKFPPKVTKVLSNCFHEQASGKYNEFKELEASNLIDGESEENDSDIEDLVQTIRPKVPFTHSKRTLETACILDDEEDYVIIRKSGWFSDKRPVGLKGGADYANRRGTMT